MIYDTVEAGKWEGIQAGEKGPMITHLMFVKYLLIFGKANVNQIQEIKGIIDQFFVVSGQRINYEKSNIIFSKNTNSSVRRQIILASGLKETRRLDMYLISPITSRCPKVVDYHHLVEKIKMKLSNWKNNHLSMAVRATLAKTQYYENPFSQWLEKGYHHG